MLAVCVYKKYVCSLVPGSRGSLKSRQRKRRKSRCHSYLLSVSALSFTLKFSLSFSKHGFHLLNLVLLYVAATGSRSRETGLFCSNCFPLCLLCILTDVSKSQIRCFLVRFMMKPGRVFPSYACYLSAGFVFVCRDSWLRDLSAKGEHNFATCDRISCEHTASCYLIRF